MLEIGIASSANGLGRAGGRERGWLEGRAYGFLVRLTNFIFSLSFTRSREADLPRAHPHISSVALDSPSYDMTTTLNQRLHRPSFTPPQEPRHRPLTGVLVAQWSRLGRDSPIRRMECLRRVGAVGRAGTDSEGTSWSLG